MWTRVEQVRALISNLWFNQKLKRWYLLGERLHERWEGSRPGNGSGRSSGTVSGPGHVQQTIGSVIQQGRRVRHVPHCDWGAWWVSGPVDEHVRRRIVAWSAHRQRRVQRRHESRITHVRYGARLGYNRCRRIRVYLHNQSLIINLANI